MQSSLKKQTVSGVIWSAVQKFGTMAIAFVSNIVLARLLSPDDYGVIGMLMIFIVVANTFVDGGFGSALIQKKEPTQEDYSTIFWWNLLLSVVLYCGLFIAAPYIAKFYKLPLLSAVLRVQSVVLILNSLSIIQQNRLRKTLLFKKLATVSIISSIISLIITIYLAYNGWGVWALVAHQIIISLFNAILYGIVGRWLPSLVFSKDSFKQLFGFGGFILLSNLINNICDNIQGLLIGKFFTPSDLGLYSQARKLEEVATSSISGVVNQVAYPVLSNSQTDKKAMINALKKFITFIAFIVFPLMFLLILIAESVITILYSEKWILCVPYFKILCIAGLAVSLQMINYNAIAAVGKSAVLFRWTIIKRGIGLVLNVGGLLLFGIYGILWGGVITSFTLYIINAALVSKYVGYSVSEQFKDLFPIISVTIITYLIVGLCQSFFNTKLYFDTMMIICIYAIVYLLLSRILNKSFFLDFSSTAMNFIRRK